jgi:hypothetical protein
MLTKPGWLLHLEGAGVLLLTIILYRAGHFHWWLFAVLLLAPDLAMLGYLWNVRMGSALYWAGTYTEWHKATFVIQSLTCRAECRTAA